MWYHPSEMHMKIGIGYRLFQAQSAECESVLTKRAHVERTSQNAEVGSLTLAIVQSNIPAGLLTAEAVALVRDLNSQIAKSDMTGTGQDRIALCTVRRARPPGSVCVHSAATRAHLENASTPDLVHCRNMQPVTRTLRRVVSSSAVCTQQHLVHPAYDLMR